MINTKQNPSNLIYLDFSYFVLWLRYFACHRYTRIFDAALSGVTTSYLIIIHELNLIIHKVDLGTVANV